jgi:hypothetical protein
MKERPSVQRQQEAEQSNSGSFQMSFSLKLKTFLPQDLSLTRDHTSKAMRGTLEMGFIEL